MAQCPSCKAVRQEGAADCPQCGIVFAKWQARENLKAIEAVAAEPAGSAPPQAPPPPKGWDVGAVLVIAFLGALAFLLGRSAWLRRAEKARLDAIAAPFKGGIDRFMPLAGKLKDAQKLFREECPPGPLIVIDGNNFTIDPLFYELPSEARAVSPDNVRLAAFAFRGEATVNTIVLTRGNQTDTIGRTAKQVVTLMVTDTQTMTPCQRPETFQGTDPATTTPWLDLLFHTKGSDPKAIYMIDYLKGAAL